MESAIGFPGFYDGLHARSGMLSHPVGVAVRAGELLIRPLGIIQNLADLPADNGVRLHGYSFPVWTARRPPLHSGHPIASSAAQPPPRNDARPSCPSRPPCQNAAISSIAFLSDPTCGRITSSSSGAYATKVSVDATRLTGASSQAK